MTDSQPMQCIALDDEPLALNVIRDYCSKVSYLNLAGTFTSAVEASKELTGRQVDLIFLDIQMPHITGIEFIKTLSNPPITIFTTAYSEHALEGFELDAIDYLVKPIPFDRFLKAVNKAYEIYSLRNLGNIASEGEQSDNDRKASYMLVKVEYSTVKVNFGDIIYIEGVKDYVKIVTLKKTLLTKSTMKHIEEKLPADEFVRVHKSYLVSLTKIEKIENNRIIFGEKYIPVGEYYKDGFYKRLERFRL